MPGSPLHLLVIIDHHATRIYVVEPRDATPTRVEPYDPHGYQRHLVHRTEGRGTGRVVPWTTWSRISPPTIRRQHAK